MSALTRLPARLWQSRDLLRLTPFSLDTVEGRSRERHRRLALTTLASLLAKVVSVLTALISVPLTLHYLGVERYGMWLTISSFIAILSFADLGMGNGLLNRIATANGTNDQPAMRGYISSALAMLSSIGALVLGVFWIGYGLVPWQGLFNVESPLAVAEAGPSIAVFATCFALVIPASIVQKVQAGLQQGFTSNLWQCAASLGALIGIVLATQLRLGLPWLVFCYVGVPLVVTTVNAVTFFASQPEISPRWSAASLSSSLMLARTGWLFLILQIVAAVSFSSDALIISHLLGPAAVPQYAVPERLFNIVGLLLTTALTPLWPAYGEAMGRADHDWVRHTFLKALLIAIAAAALGASALALASTFLLQVWVGSAVQATPLLLIGFVIWKIVEAGGNSTAMLLNAAHVVRFQALLGVATAIAVVVLKLLLIPRLGVAGAVWSNVVAFGFISVIPCTLKVTSILRRRTQLDTSPVVHRQSMR